MTKEEREELARQNEEALRIAQEDADARLASAQQSVGSTIEDSGIKGTVSGNGDKRDKSGTRSVQSGTSSGTSVQSGTSVSNQQGRSESYVQDNYTPEEQAEFNKRYVAAHPGYMLNDKGEIVRDPKAALFDVLKVERDRLRDERERQEKIQRNRKIASGLANSAMLISDMIAAGIGGNVYKRDKDNTGKEADKEIARLREAQIADDMAAKEKEKQELDKWLADYWKEFNDWRREKQKHISENSSTGNHQSIQTGQHVNNSYQQSASNSEQVTTYSAALKGGGSRGSSAGARRGSGKSKTDYIPIRVLNGPHGYSYISFEVDPKEKEALSRAVASSVRDAKYAGDTNAEMLMKTYYKKKNKNDKEASWDYDGLINDGALYQVPGVLNRYLDELTRMGMSHNEGGVDIPYTRRELYIMMTGDSAFLRVPAGVNLGQSRI